MVGPTRAICEDPTPERSGSREVGGRIRNQRTGPHCILPQRGLSSSTFVRYRKRQQQTSCDAGDGKRWLKVEVCSAPAVTSGERASGLAVVLAGGRRIEIGRSFDADTLKRLLAVVERD